MTASRPPIRSALCWPLRSASPFSLVAAPSWLSEALGAPIAAQGGAGRDGTVTLTHHQVKCPAKKSLASSAPEARRGPQEAPGAAQAVGAAASSEPQGVRGSGAGTEGRDFAPIRGRAPAPKLPKDVRR